MHRGDDRSRTQGAQMGIHLGRTIVCDRQFYYEYRTASFVVTHRNHSTMQLGIFLHQVESDATASGRLHLGAVHLIEAVENILLLFIADTLAGVNHIDAKHIVLAALHLETGLGTQRNHNLAAIRSKLIGVAQEVVHYLAHFIHIHRHVQLREF